MNAVALAHTSKKTRKHLPIGDVTFKITKGTTPTTIGGRFVDKGINFLKVESISEFGSLEIEKLAQIDEESDELLRRSRLEENDVLFSIAGAIGRTYLVRLEDLPANVNQALAIIRFDPSKVHPKYGYYSMRDGAFQGDALGRVVQCAQANVNLAQLAKSVINIPPLDEQRRIADILSAYDDLIENNRRRMAILEEAARHLYREWFVSLRFPGHEHTRIISGVPEGWKRTPVPEAIAINPRTPLSDDDEHWWVEMADLPTNSMVIQNAVKRDGRSGSKFRNGDTLFARITPCLENGKTAFVNFMAENEVGRGSTEFIVLRSMSLTPEFVYCLARTYDFREHAIKSMIGASGRQRVQESCFEKFLILVPPRSLLALFGESFEPVFEQIKILHAQNQKLHTARDLLLPRLMSGEIVI